MWFIFVIADYLVCKLTNVSLPEKDFKNTLWVNVFKIKLAGVSHQHKAFIWVKDLYEKIKNIILK